MPLPGLEPPEAEALTALRWRVRRLADDRGAPALTVAAGLAVMRGGAAWAAFCRTAGREELEQAEAALQAGAGEQEGGNADQA